MPLLKSRYPLAFEGAAWTDMSLRIRSSLVAIGVLCWTCSSPKAYAQGACPPIPVDAVSQSADLSVKTLDGSCTLDWASDGGYIKVWTTYKLHISAAVTGSCQTRAFQSPPGECVVTGLQLRSLGSSWLYEDIYLGAVVQPNDYVNEYQNYDTIVPTNTGNTGTSFMSTSVGPHYFNSSTSVTDTSCHFTPTSFAQNNTITVNTLTCEPRFLLDNGHISRLQTGNTIHVYLPPSMSGASTQLTAAVNDWNGRLGGTGVTLDVVTSACESGPTCISISTDASLTSCGIAQATSVDPDSGIIAGGITLRLRPDWNTRPYSSEGLQRTFDHELGHLLGMNNANASACGVSDAVMQDQFDCVATSVMHDVTINDYLPVSNTVYGGHSRKACGF